jgi:hypothetical protein
MSEKKQAIRTAYSSLFNSDGHPRNQQEVRRLEKMENWRLYDPAVVGVLLCGLRA